MPLKLAGFALVLFSLILAAIMLSGVQTYQRTEPNFVYGNFLTGVEPIMEIPIQVPPLNSSLWVGFNFTLSEDHVGYEAYGVMLPWNGSEYPDVAMSVVNETGRSNLVNQGYSTDAWDETKVYAAAILNKSIRYFTFKFRDLDGAQLYHAVFRGYEDKTQPSIVMISIKESWLEKAPLMPIQPFSVGVSGVLAAGGVSILVYSFWSKSAYPARRKQKRRFPR